MVFWLAIFAGALFTWIAIRIGFYETWTLLFNILISVYIAVFLTPIVIDVIPAAGDTRYGTALTMIAIAIGFFLILYGISYIFLTGQFKVSFPKIFDILFAGLLGFLTGFLVLSFIAFVITIAPISHNRFLTEAGFNRQSQQANISYICWWCDLVNLIVSSPKNKITSEQAMNKLLSNAQSRPLHKTADQTEPNKPIESNNVEISIGEEK